MFVKTRISPAGILNFLESVLSGDLAGNFLEKRRKIVFSGLLKT